jgi:hypothetical protein
LTRSIVHIGYHKTASTWFQRVYYPEVRNLRYVDRLLVKQAFLGHSGFHFDPDLARKELGMSAPDEPVILCEEGLSGYIHNGGLYGFLSLEMARRIRLALPDARIVVFIRSQPDIISACYQQYIRGGGTYRPRRYLHAADYLHGAIAAPYKVPRFSFDHFDYLALIRHYEELFGRESVHVIAYEIFRRDSRAFLEDYGRRLELDLDLNALDLKPKNASYSLPIVQIARVLNRFTYRTVNDKRFWVHIPGWYSTRRFILETINGTGWLGRTPSPEALLGADEIRQIEERFREPNRQLAEHTGLSLGELGYPV